MRNFSKWMLAAALLTSACGERSKDWDQQRTVLGPVVAANRLVYLQANAAILTALDPSNVTPALHLDVLSRGRSLAATPDGVVLVGGSGAEPGLDYVKLPSGERVRFSLPGAYDNVAVSPNGQYLVLSYDPNRLPAAGGPAARNNNEITVINLKSQEKKTLALRTESLAPQSVVFSSDGLVVAVVLDAAIAFVELSDPSVHVHVPLKLPGGQVLGPKKAVFSQDGAFLFVHASNTDDVLALEVLRSPGEIGSAINFLFFPGASGLQDILVPDGPGFDRSIVALYSSFTGSQMVLLDAEGDSSKTKAAQLTRRLTSLANLGDGQVLGWSDPDRRSPEESRAVAGWLPLEGRMDEDLLQGPVKSEPQFSAGGAFFPHGTVGARSALTGVTLDDDGARLRVRLAPIVLGGVPTATALDVDGGTLFVSVAVDREESGAALDRTYNRDTAQVGSIVALQADSLGIGGLALDASVTRLGVVGSHLYAVHNASFGDVTFTPLDKLERESARRMTGFLAGRLADRGEK